MFKFWSIVEQHFYLELESGGGRAYLGYGFILVCAAAWIVGSKLYRIISAVTTRRLK